MAALQVGGAAAQFLSLRVGETSLQASCLSSIGQGGTHVPCIQLKQSKAATLRCICPGLHSYPFNENIDPRGSLGRTKKGIVAKAQVTTEAPPASTGSSRQRPKLLDLVPEMKVEELDIDLPLFDPNSTTPVDLLVVGAGPAGLAVAKQVSASGLNVCCIDPAPKSIWPNNYGVWVDEFEDMGLTDCLDHTWTQAVVHLNETDEKFLDRPYGRVNRVKLKTKMIQQCIDNGVKFYQAKVENVVHDRQSSVVSCSSGVTMKAALILDATGHSRRLVKYDQPFNPGYQAAWGIMAEVESHPFDLDKMLFMDWRDSHLENSPVLKKRNEEIPTFLYAMPFSATKIFLEETSLVARPALDFRDIQERMEERLKHLGIKVLSIEEEEYCLIPMGGVLPEIPQRVLGIGGTAGMVHPSTGYMVARTLAAAPALADAIVSHLRGAAWQPGAHAPADSSSGAPTLAPEGAKLATTGVSGDELSAAVWREIWPRDRQEQREFFCFGMDLDLAGTRRFFAAFFDLSPYHWQGFLSSRLYLSELIGFGAALFVRASNASRIEIIIKGTPGLGSLIKNVVGIKQSR
eukprot:jgi/Mesen1/10290/ME000079S09707